MMRKLPANVWFVRCGLRFIMTARAHTDYLTTYTDYVKDKKNA
jgi:hypothetical protein